MRRDALRLALLLAATVASGAGCSLLLDFETVGLDAPDASAELRDAAAEGDDASVGQDASTDAVDAGDQQPDASELVPDAAEPGPDAAEPGLDAAEPGLDAGACDDGGLGCSLKHLYEFEGEESAAGVAMDSFGPASGVNDLQWSRGDAGESQASYVPSGPRGTVAVLSSSAGLKATSADLMKADIRTESFSACAWFNQSADLANTAGLLQLTDPGWQDVGWNLNLIPSPSAVVVQARLYCYMGGATCDGNALCAYEITAPGGNQNTWHHACLVLDVQLNRLSLSVDGAFYGDGIDYPESCQNYPVGNSMYFEVNRNRRIDGLVDQIAYWDRALSAEEVAALYASGAGTDLP